MNKFSSYQCPACFNPPANSVCSEPWCPQRLWPVDQAPVGPGIVGPLVVVLALVLGFLGGFWIGQ